MYNYVLYVYLYIDIVNVLLIKIYILRSEGLFLLIYIVFQIIWRA